MAILVALALPTPPPSYEIRDGSLTVRSGERFSDARSMRLSDVTAARIVTLHGGSRRAGTSLPGLCAGRFSYPDLGVVWQVTDCRRVAIFIEAIGQPTPIVITPPEPGDFLAAMRVGIDALVVLPPADRTILVVLALVMIPLSLLTVAFVSAVAHLGPRRMYYSVGGGMLEARTLFGGKRWPTGGARARRYTPTRLRRVMGTAMPGYYTGRYREAGESTRVYATNIRDVVLFEGPARVILSPEDPDALLRALKEEGVSVLDL